ncbi:MAG TPA: molecular chaperone TorD family protein [Caldimonas sp.]|nr:molecular chaperone TorD family protein [Caldimonas sp.]
MATVQFTPADEREDLARAEVYGLLADLYRGPPSAELYAQLQVAVTDAPERGAFLEANWRELVGAARRLTRDAVAAEYADLFIGVGKPEILPFGSYHLAGRLHERPLVELRRDLAAIGLERPEGVHETEDHLSCLCEVMRYLIAGDDVSVSNLESQRRFHDAHVRPWIEAFCATLVAHPRADFYRALATFTRDFFAVEAQAFDLLDT